MKNLGLILFLGVLLVVACTPNKPILKIGLIADPQYKDAPTAGARHYRESLVKLLKAIDTLNDHQVDFIQSLGDIIDGEWRSFDSIMPVYAKLNSEIESYHVLGNHDFSVDSLKKPEILKTLGMPNYYYSYVKKNWRFIVLDGTDYSYFSNSVHKYNQEKIDAMYAEMADKENHRPWNGGMGEKQKEWLKKELKTAESLSQDVILFSHYPVRPYHGATLWNSDEIVSILKESPSVVAYINGHHHASGYAFEDGIHYITMFAMVNTDIGSFGILNIYQDSLVLKGYGNQKSMTLQKHVLNEDVEQY